MKNILLLFLLILVSCNRSYQNDISYYDGILFTGNCTEKTFTNTNELEVEIKSKIEQYVKNKIGNKYFAELEFENGKILTNENKNCSYDFNYPLYSITYNLNFKKSGLRKFSIAFLMDKTGKVIDQLEFPKMKLNSEKLNLIPLKEIHKILGKRNIPTEKLSIEFLFDKKKNTFYWSTKSLVSGGMETKDGCSITYKKHFKVNAISGKITNYK